jgi:uncharacterized protein YbbK (DUF523 family)/uncharacterized protein YbgA (DUF1722 family)
MLELKMSSKIKIGISSCLIGKKTRYDGDHRRDDCLLKAVGRYVKWVPVCPEVECGLSVPREPMKLVGNIKHSRLITKKTKMDQTERIKKYSNRKLKALEKEDLDGFIFKGRSPSCGIKGVKVFDRSGLYRMSGGLFADTFIKGFPNTPVEDELRLKNKNNLQNFIDRIVIHSRWNTYTKNIKSISGLTEFHASHKFTIMAHSPKSLRELDRMISNAKKYNPKKLYDKYLNILMEGMRFQATVKKNVKVLRYLLNILRKELTKEDRDDLMDVIEHYHLGIVPITVPVNMLKIYIRKFKNHSLKDQYYLNPIPIEIMQRK